MELSSQRAPDRGVLPSRFETAFGAGVMVATVLYVVACFVGQSYGWAFFSIPVFVGFIVGSIAPSRPYRLSICALLFALLLAVVTLREGVICVLFSLPVIVPLVLVGAFAGAVVVRHVRDARARNHARTLTFLLALGWQVVDGVTDEPRQHPVHVARASIAVDAPPDEVFAALTSGELSVARRWPWFIRVGLPMPERMVVEEPGPNGRVRFDFDQGTAFARIREWNPPRALAYGVERIAVHDLPFHITRLGKSPDYGFARERVEDWLGIEDTRYELARTPEGGTRLSRRVVWRRHLAPGFYFGWLQQTVMERGQLRLLELVRDRVEARPPPRPSSAVAEFAAAGEFSSPTESQSALLSD